jgi:predicted RNase H-like nuclease (RuvC/YqgF family)
VSVTNDKRPPETKQEQIRYSTPESSGPTSQQSFTLKVEQLEKQNSELRSTNDRLMAKLDELSRALMTEE